MRDAVAGLRHHVRSRGRGGGTKSESFGNSEWGAGYQVSGGVRYAKPWLGAPAEITASSSLSAWARIDGTRKTLVSVYASGKAQESSASLGVNVYLVGKQLWTQSWSSSFSTTSKSWSKSFFTVSINATVGPIPVTASATPKGSLGYRVGGSVSTNGIAANFTPFVAASVNSSVGIGHADFASGGLYSDIKLLEVSLPATLSMRYAPVSGCSTGLSATAKLALDIETLSGQAGLYAELFGKRWELPLTPEWDGITHAGASILNNTSSLCGD